MDYLLAMVIFAITTSVTPGPNNILVMSSGVNFGSKRSLPLLTGICVGFALMIFLVGVGLGQVFAWFPALHTIIKALGSLYLLYLAWLIMTSSGIGDSSAQSEPLTFFKGALFQWVNAKAWVVATGAIAAFGAVGSSAISQNLLLCSIFLVVAFPCVGVWLLFGVALKKYLTLDRYRRWFNFSMGGLLALSVMPVLYELIQEFDIL